MQLLFSFPIVSNAMKIFNATSFVFFLSNDMKRTKCKHKGLHKKILQTKQCNQVGQQASKETKRKKSLNTSHSKQETNFIIAHKQTKSQKTSAIFNSKNRFECKVKTSVSKLWNKVQNIIDKKKVTFKWKMLETQSKDHN